MTRVLVIDDEPSILRALRINLTARDYEVTTAADGASGLAAVASKGYRFTTTRSMGAILCS